MQHPTRSDQPMFALEESRRWGRQALQEIREMARDRYYEANDDDEDDEDESEEEFEEFEDDEEY